MITVYKNRRVPRDRIPSVGNKGPTQQVATYNSFLRGLDTSRPLFGRPDGSLLVADNVTIETSGLAPRAGSLPVCLTPMGVGTIRRIVPIPATSSVFAICDSGIFRVPEVPGAAGALTTPTAVTGVTVSNGRVSSFQMQNDAGRHVFLLSGSSAPLRYGPSAGTDTWQDAGLLGAGLTPDHLISGWVHQERAFFIEKNTLNAWYLQSNHITGTCSKLPLAGVFNESTELLFGASFSTDSGSGLDDYNMFVTKEGEVAIYAGNNPGATDGSFSLKGVYKIPTPLGRDAHMNLGGDVIVATVGGLVPISAVLSKDVTQLALHSMSQAIDADLSLEIAKARSFTDAGTAQWDLIKSEFHNLAFLTVPRRNQPEEYIYVVNMKTNGWSRFTNWRVLDLAAAGDNVYYTDGLHVYKAMTTGRDVRMDPTSSNPQATVTYSIPHRIVTAFDDFGADGRNKIIHNVRVTSRSEFDVKSNVTLACDLTIPLPTYPRASSTLDVTAAKWGTDASDSNGGIWDTSEWAATFTEQHPRYRKESQYKNCNSAAIQMTFMTDGPIPIRGFVMGASVSFSIGDIFT